MDAVTQGTLVAERYRLIRQIGFGGMGAVWLVYDEALASSCAIKLLLPEPGRNEELEIRLEYEAKCAAQLRSPHVVDVLNRGHWQGKPFIVMEYLDGEDLAARLDRVGRLDATTTYRIVVQVARALTRAHGIGIIHRDVKPANIFLVPGEEHEIAKVLDFGIAKHGALPNAFENPQQASFIGTPCYMSPEQLRGEPADYRSDLWALAMITYECLTGALPFPDDSVVKVVRAITLGDFPSLTANHPELPHALEAWWRRATAPQVAQRFQSAKELADALGEALDAYPKLPISRGFHADAEAATLLAPPELAPPSPRRPAVPQAAVDPGAAATLHAHSHAPRVRAKSSKRDSSLYIPLRSRRGLSLAAAAACAVLGFAASSFCANLDLDELGRQWQAATSHPAPAPRTDSLSATSAALDDSEALPKPADRIIPAALEVVPVGSPAPRKNAMVAQPPALHRAQPKPRGADMAASLAAAGEPSPDLPGELLDPPAPRARRDEAPVRMTAPVSNEPLPRVMPPGEKDYGI